MTPAEYIQQAQDLLEFHLKMSRYYVELWKDFPWLIQFENAPPFTLTIDTPLGRNNTEGGFGYGEGNEIYYVQKDEGRDFHVMKRILFIPFMLAISEAGLKYQLQMWKSKELGVGIDDTFVHISCNDHMDLSKGFKSCMRGLCEAFDEDVKRMLENELDVP